MVGVASILPSEALAPLRSVHQAGYRHVAQFEERTVTEDPETGEEEVTGLQIISDPLRVRLRSVGARIGTLAAAQGIRVQWELRAPLSLTVTPGMFVVVRGIKGGRVSWVRLLEITGDLGLTNRMGALLTAVDADLSR